MRALEWNACTCPWILAQFDCLCFTLLISVSHWQFTLNALQSLQRKKDHDYILLTFLNNGQYTEMWTQQEVSLTIFFSDANVFLVFLIIHVHAYNYEKLSIFIVFTGNDASCTCWIFYSHNLIKLTNLDECHGYSTSKNSNNFIFSLVFFYYWLSLNLKLIHQHLQCLMTKKKIYFVSVV